MKQKVKVAIALGSNLGDREKTIRVATQRIQEEFLENVIVSSLIETEPWGIKEQPKFLNGVMVGISEWKPPAILNYLKTLEKELGRTHTVINGPRVIDLDLVCYGDQIWNSDGVKVPHPRMSTRLFVLAPLNEVWPDWIHPELNKSPSELIREIV